MSSSTSSSDRPGGQTRWGRTARPLWAFLAVNVVASLIVLAIPWKGAGYFQDLCVEEVAQGTCEILLMGDSKVFPFVEGYTNCPFFTRPTRALAMDSATVLYQRNLYNRIVRETEVRPKVVFYSTGANNFNANGLHILRDYTIRFIAGPKELVDYSSMPGSLPYLADAFFCRLYPIYGRRIEISHLMVRGYKPRSIDLAPPVRDPVADENYLLIYKRGVLTDYRVSDFHLENLRVWAEEIRAQNGELVVLDLPVTEEMRELEHEVCQEWDEKIAEFSAETGVRYVDLRGQVELPFRDINHLSNLGAKLVVERWLAPIAEEGRKADRITDEMD